jgi:hypothetical protein
VYAGGIVGFAENTAISFCVSSADITVEGHGFNSSAGGIAGNLRAKSTVADCSATGAITLHSGDTGGLMLYGGGILGYNYGGCIVRECYSKTGTVTARGTNLPYSGGVSGYNSQLPDNPAVIENCYSSMAVSAVASSKQALAGGITGANAQGAIVSKCYALGAVVATVNGSSSAGAGGSIGVPASANAGGIAGAQYVNGPFIRNCVALNTEVKGADSGSGAAYNVRRIAGPGTGELIGTWEHNIAYVTILAAGSNAIAPQSDRNGYDGETCAAKPTQAAYTALGWDFNTVWKMAADGYPVLRWQ